jgi:hypothetical protein
MRLIKVAVLAPVVILAISGSLGASTASASFNTALCMSAELNCSSAAKFKLIHLELANALGATNFVLHGVEPLVKVECLGVLALGEVLALGTSPEPQQVHMELTFAGCSSNAVHNNNCTVKTLETPVLFDFLTLVQKERALVTALNGSLLVKCLILGVEADCKYQGENIEFEFLSLSVVNHRGQLIMGGRTLERLSGGALCPSELTIGEGVLEQLPYEAGNEATGSIYVSS